MTEMKEIIEIPEKKDEIAKIKVIGVGGAGGNAINSMIAHKLEGVKFIAVNTDKQALDRSLAEIKIPIGTELTCGLGAGGNPDMGRDAAMESAEAIKEALKDSHMVFIAAGLGGGTGTGAAPTIAKLSKELGALTVGVITKPFSFEGKHRSKLAEAGLDELRKVADTVITIPNDRLRGIASKNAKMKEMFNRADDILHHSVKSITDLIFKTGYINLDFADVRATMSKPGMAIMGIGVASGEKRAREAAQRAISHPLLEDISIKGARAILMNLTASSDVTIEEITEASDYIHTEAGNDAEVFWGTVFDDNVGDEMRITVIATGIGAGPELVVKGKPFSHGRPMRGTVRDITVDDLKYIKNTDKDEGVIIKKAVNQSHNIVSDFQSYKGGQFDSGDLDVPTFLRKKAD